MPYTYSFFKLIIGFVLPRSYRDVARFITSELKYL